VSLVWLNGGAEPAGSARIHVTDRGFTLGDGVFETIRAEGGVPAHLPRHFKRLRDGAAVLDIEIPFSDWILTKALREVADGADCALRLTLTRGPMARGVLPARAPRALPTILITAGALAPPAPPARVIVATCTRRNEMSPLSRIKSLNYGDSILARQEAAAQGADDALLLNTRGTLAEATAANVFLLCYGRWVTPPVDDGALPGIARAQLLRRRAAIEASIGLDDLVRATAGFLVNSLGMRSLAAIGDRELLVVEALGRSKSD
jgi:branched-chain amino acid aminotransferase